MRAEHTVTDGKEDHRADAEETTHPAWHRAVTRRAHARAGKGDERHDDAEDEAPQGIQGPENPGQGPDADVTNDHAGSF